MYVYSSLCPNFQKEIIFFSMSCTMKKPYSQKKAKLQPGYKKGSMGLCSYTTVMDNEMKTKNVSKDRAQQ